MDAERRKEILELWDVFRKYVEHEDLLLNQRVSRMLVVQGVMFAAAGAVLTEVIKTAAQMRPTHAPPPATWLPFGPLTGYVGFLAIVAAAGAVNAWLSKVEIGAADRALHGLEDRWEDSIELEELEQLRLPGLLRGGVDPQPLERKEGTWLPMLFLVIWIILGFSTVGIAAYRSHSGYAIPEPPAPATPQVLTCPAPAAAPAPKPAPRATSSPHAARRGRSSSGRP